MFLLDIYSTLVLRIVLKLGILYPLMFYFSLVSPFLCSLLFWLIFIISHNYFHTSFWLIQTLLHLLGTITFSNIRLFLFLLPRPFWIFYYVVCPLIELVCQSYLVCFVYSIMISFLFLVPFPWPHLLRISGILILLVLLFCLIYCIFPVFHYHYLVVYSLIRIILRLA